MFFLGIFICILLNTCATSFISPNAFSLRVRKTAETVDESNTKPKFSPQSKAELKDAVAGCLDIGDSKNARLLNSTPGLLEEYVKKFPPADPAVIKILNQELDTLGYSSARMEEAARRSIERPTEGFDQQFGLSAIKTYRACVYPKKDAAAITDRASALRCAQRVDCLVKQHKSNKAAGIRDADSPMNPANIVRNPLILLLDNLRSAFNVGSLFRTADACACKELVTTLWTPHPGGGGAEKVTK